MQGMDPFRQCLPRSVFLPSITDTPNASSGSVVNLNAMRDRRGTDSCAYTGGMGSLEKPLRGFIRRY